MKALKIILIAGGAFMVLLFFGLAYIGMVSPETFVYTKNDVPQKYVKEMRELSLLENSERLQYMYSDALFDIKDGIYALTDKHLIIYCDEWSDPKTIIAFNEIIDLYVEYDDSFINDSYITVEYAELQVSFPVSSEKGRDKDFFNYLYRKVEENR